MSFREFLRPSQEKVEERALLLYCKPGPETAAPRWRGRSYTGRRWVALSSAATHALPSLTAAVSTTAILRPRIKWLINTRGLLGKCILGAAYTLLSYVCSKGWKGIRNPGQQGAVPEPGDPPGRRQPLLEMHLGSPAWNLLLGLATESSPQSRIRSQPSPATPVTSSNCPFQTWKRRVAGTGPSQKLSSGKHRLIRQQTGLAGSWRHWNGRLLCCGQGQTNVVKNYSRSSHAGLFQNVQAHIHLVIPHTPYVGDS